MFWNAKQAVVDHHSPHPWIWLDRVLDGPTTGPIEMVHISHIFVYKVRVRSYIDFIYLR